MTYAGARGETAAEMKKALHFNLADSRLHTAFDYIDLALASRGKNAAGKDGKPFRLNDTNSIWGQKGTSFETPFLDTLAVNYGAGPQHRRLHRGDGEVAQHDQRLGRGEDRETHQEHPARRSGRREDAARPGERRLLQRGVGIEVRAERDRASFPSRRPTARSCRWR